MKAMACSLPVIAPAEGGIPELLGKDGDGVLLHDLSEEHLHEALQALVDNPQLAIDMGMQAKLTISQRYDVEVTGSVCSELYQHCVRSMSHSVAARSVSTSYKRRTETSASG